MVGLDSGRRPLEGNAFDDVGVERPLGQVFDPAQLLGFGGEDADEFVADAAPLLLRVDDPFQLAQEVHRGVHVNQVQVVMLPEEVKDFLRLPFAQQAVVDEDAGQAVADGPVDQHRGDRGVHPAGQGADDLAVAHLLPDVFGGGLDEGGHGPQGIELTDAEQKVAENLFAPGRVVHFGMKLHPVQPPGEVSDGPGGAGVAAADHLEPRRQALHPVAVAHPDLLFGVQAVKQIVKIADGEGFVTVFPGPGRGHLAAQEMVEELDAVADAQDRHPEAEQVRVHGRGVPVVDAPGASRQDDGLGGKLLDGRQRHDVGVNFAVDLEFPHPPGNELGVLGAEVQDEHFFLMGIEHFCIFCMGEGPAGHATGGCRSPSPQPLNFLNQL